jgi:hypothetical protein
LQQGDLGGRELPIDFRDPETAKCGTEGMPLGRAFDVHGGAGMEEYWKQDAGL